MNSKNADFIWFDGEFKPWDSVTVPITTHAIHYGTSVFEGIRGYSNDENLFVFKLKEHMERLIQSAEVYSINSRFTLSEICTSTVELLKKNNIKKSCYIRPLLFVGLHGIDLNVTRNSPSHLAIIAFPFNRYFPETGIRTCISSWRRINENSTPPMAKAGGNYMNSVLATQECKRNGYDESILLDYQGNVSEAPGENIFLVRGNKIYTPPLSDSVLEGITRDTAITLAKRLGYEVQERSITRTELYIADELFVTGTAAEITPIISVDNHKVGSGQVGEITKKISDFYQKVVVSQISDYREWLTPVW
ncbi:branched-chain amino acid transaminase [Candidatus Nitrosocosmicus hydrocola]|jgi:branched-chain amino acid aminotransferase|uniref:branched-chain amino acid transaminase n=1 Tax=Candidatus Nitrosocosmicus hydrocola TaxID=1826872 RepID=UPI000ACBC450|nr:branched-chain amino acid transaminase [Candidatus Nitrosocosmicus hydrocola]